MTGGIQRTGRCLCGAVRFTAELANTEVGACHCGVCRRQGSGPIFAALGVQAIGFEGDEHITRYKSSEWGERGFCARCGGNLFFRDVQADQYHVSPCVFDDQEGWRFVEQIYVDRKPGFYAFANQTRTLTGAEFVAAFMAGAGEGEARR